MSIKVFYTASYFGKANYQKYYDMVLAAIKQNDVDLISTEEGTYANLMGKKAKDILPTGDNKDIHYEAVKKGILWADCVIIEISNESFQLGHEATLAIQNKKHVLCLSIKEDFSEKIKNRYFHGAKYNQFNVEEHIENFVNFVAGERLDKRFNMFLSQSQMEFLEKKATDSGVNMSEYLRQLIDKDRV